MKIIMLIIAVAVAAVGYWLIKPTLSDDVVNEEIAVQLPADVVPADSAQASLPTDTPEPSQDSDAVTSGAADMPADNVQPKLYQGSFQDADPSHLASGQVYISGRDLSLVNLDSTNVPDGRLYLATDVDATDFVDLGALKGNKGNQNYRLPDDVDVDDYSHVLIWCRAFSVLVGSAEIE